MTWAQEVAAALPSSTNPWPPYEGKAAAIARRKVAGLSRDARVTEALAVACWEHARSWGEKRNAPPWWER
jgi:hypothetical protein